MELWFGARIASSRTASFREKNIHFETNNLRPDQSPDEFVSL